jgi:hypothetical protein
MKQGVKKQGKAGRNGHCPTCGAPIDTGRCCTECRSSGAYDRWIMSLSVGAMVIAKRAWR